MPRCPRCGLEFVRKTVRDIHCDRCTREVAAIIAADTARRQPRFPFGKDLGR